MKGGRITGFFIIIFSRVADPDSHPGSGIGLFRIPDLGSRIRYPKPIFFRAYLTNIWVKISIILSKLGQIFSSAFRK
jgi:hypothetical protein